MRSFYSDTALTQAEVATGTISFLEKGKLHPPTGGPRHQVTFRLTPVGIERVLPQSLLEIKTCLRNQLNALARAHSKNWCIVDVRWDNIVLYQNNWYIIDCAEHCHRFNDPLVPGLVNLQLDPATGVAPTHSSSLVDMRQLAWMWGASQVGAAVVALIQADPNGNDFLQKLPTHQAASLLVHNFLQ